MINILVGIVFALMGFIGALPTRNERRHRSRLRLFHLAPDAFLIAGVRPGRLDACKDLEFPGTSLDSNWSVYPDGTDRSYWCGSNCVQNCSQLAVSVGY